MVAEARAVESATQTNKLIANSSKEIDEEVHWTTGHRQSQMKLRREPGTRFRRGDLRGAHPWKVCPANGKTLLTCGGNDHFARVCLEGRKFTTPEDRPQNSRNNYTRKQQPRVESDQRRDRRRNVQRRDPHTARSNQSQVLLYTDMYFAEEQQYDTPLMTFAASCIHVYLETQVYSIAANSQPKCYFTNLSLPTTGSAFVQVKFQIDTAATCSTISLSTLRSLLPNAEIKQIPLLSTSLWKLQASET